jgi:mevalonate kinase
LIAHAKAPGKIILLGEHFVVHGNPALAAALDRGVEARVSASEEDVLASKEMGLECPIWSPVGQLKPVAVALQRLMEKRSLKGARVAIDSSIPVSAGLGSSAASSVAALAAVATFFDVTVSQDTLFNLAMVSERIVHGNPSGVDVYVAIHGGMVYFRERDRKVVHLRERYPVMVACTGVARNTGELVSRVAKFKQDTPRLYRTLAKASEKLVEDCRKALEKGSAEVIPASMNFHQQALKAMGVSSPELDSLIKDARLSGFAGAKLTGAGGGGCLIGWPGTMGFEASFSKFHSKHPNSFSSYIPSEGVTTWQTPS